MQSIKTFLILSILAFAVCPPARSSDQGNAAEHLQTIERRIARLEQQSAQKNGGDGPSLESQLQQARLDFISNAANVELPAPESEVQSKKRDLIAELQQLVEPLVDAVIRLSEKPRRIETLRTQIFKISDQMSLTDHALANLNRVIQDRTYPALEPRLKESRDTLMRARDDLDVRATTLQRKLDLELSDHRSVAQAATEAVRDFFASKGRHLLLAGLIFACVYWGTLRLMRLIFASRWMSPKLRGVIKPIQVMYGILAGLIAILATIITLHFLNDWFLVTLLCLTLLAAVWSSKALITLFIGEMKLVLNLGPVKQGERVVWQGLPWLVKSLGFRSVLVNEALQGGTITLPAAALTAMISRPTVENEPWFPTRVGDFVLLDDGCYGRVEIQTLETVVLVVGKTKKHYSTAAFLAKNPQRGMQGESFRE